jgi:hypothetical protein
MAGAVFKCIIDFSNGATFDPALVLDDPTTPLDTAVLGTAAADTLDVTQYVISARIRRSYNRTSDSFLGGSAQVRLIDQTGLFNPANTSGANYGKILPMRKIRFTGTYLGTEYALGSMYIQEWKYTSPVGLTPAFVDLNCVDGFQLLNLTTISTVSGGSAGQTTAQRITSLLDAGDWPAMRSISTTATTTVQADDGSSRSLLGACQTVEQTELGAFFMDERGFANFKSRNDIISASGGTPYIFSDVASTSAITYQAINFDLSDAGLINRATVTRTGGSAQTATDSASILAYFEHSRIRSGIMQTDADALNQAQLIIASRKEIGTDINLQSITVNLASDDQPSRVVAGLDMDIFTPITATQTLPSGAVTVNSVVTGVGYDVSPNNFTATFTTAQPFAVGFVLDSSVDGVLNQDILSY